jgi:hypothetical protein
VQLPGQHLECRLTWVEKRVVPGVGELVQGAPLARFHRSGDVRAALSDRHRLVAHTVDEDLGCAGGPAAAKIGRCVEFRAGLGRRAQPGGDRTFIAA